VKTQLVECVLSQLGYNGAEHRVNTEIPESIVAL